MSKMEKKAALLWVLLFFSAFLFRLSVSSSRSLNRITEQATYFSGQSADDNFRVAFGIGERKELYTYRRIDIETNDYSGTGANNHHDPRPPGSS